MAHYLGLKDGLLARTIEETSGLGARARPSSSNSTEKERKTPPSASCSTTRTWLKRKALLSNCRAEVCHEEGDTVLCLA